MKTAQIGFIVLIFYSLSGFAGPFSVCKSRYALCTTAECKPIVGMKGLASCRCKVVTGYSAATQKCKPVKQTPQGPLIYSRYHPIKSYVVCSNKRPWAWCLDKPCIVDKNNPAKAACFCTIVKNQGKYIIVTDKRTATTCTTGLYSSATIKQVTQITHFLKTQRTLLPHRIKIIK